MHADFVDDAVRTLRAAAPGDLARVSEAAAVLAHGDHLLVQVVREARAAGRSWSQIAAALETSTAVARQRWGSPRQDAERAELRWSPVRAPVLRADEVLAQPLVLAAAALRDGGMGLTVGGDGPAPGGGGSGEDVIATVSGLMAGHGPGQGSQ